MSENDGVFSKVSSWFRRRFSGDEDLPLLHGQTETPTALARRPIFGLWGKREEDLTGLQNGLTSMAGLMQSMRQYLEQQNARHDELLTYLSQLSHALQSIPDSGRVQSETLRVLHQQIAYQNAQHKQLSDMIRKIFESSGTQHDIVEMMRDRVEALYKNDEQISSTVQGMGDAMTVVSQQSQTNTMILERLRDNLVNRDGELERAIRRENRWTRSTLLIVGSASIVALFISVGMAIYSWRAISSMTDAVNARLMSPIQSQSPSHASPSTPSPAPEVAPSVSPQQPRNEAPSAANVLAAPVLPAGPKATTQPATAPAAKSSTTSPAVQAH